MITSYMAVAFFVVLMIVAAVGDVLSLRISNLKVIIVFSSFFPVAILVGMPWHLIGLNTFAALSSLLVGFALFHLGALGGVTRSSFPRQRFGWVGRPCCRF